MKSMELVAIVALTDAGNHARYDNEYFTAQFLEAEQMVDAVERDAIFKELAVIALDDVLYPLLLFRKSTIGSRG